MSIVKRFLSRRKAVKSSLSFRVCQALFNKLSSLQKKTSYLYFIPVSPFVPKAKEEERKEITPFSSLLLKINVSKENISNLLRIIEKSQGINKFFEKSLFFYNLSSIIKFFNKTLIHEKGKLTKLYSQLSDAITDFHTSSFHVLFSKSTYGRIIQSPIKSPNLLPRVSLKFLDVNRLLYEKYIPKRNFIFEKLVKGIPKTLSREIVVSRKRVSFPGIIIPSGREYILTTCIYKIYRFFRESRMDKALEDKILKAREFPSVSTIRFYRSLGEKISKFESIPLSKIYEKIISYSQYRITGEIYNFKTLSRRSDYAKISPVFLRTSVYTFMRENLTGKIPNLKTYKKLEYGLPFFKIPKQPVSSISSIIKIREKTMRLATEKITPYTVYLTTGIREIYRRGGKPYIIYEYPRSPTTINISLPAVTAGRLSTKNVNYTFRNVINVTVNVSSLESDRDIRELGRKIGRILAEEARKHGVEL